jgi:clan AA aspartic protease (TIGR02281 family)
MSRSKTKRCGIRAGSLLVASLALSFPGAAQTPDVGADLAATMERLSIKLPPQVAESDAVKRPLEELGRERCDQSAIGNLGTALEKAGYRREAAVAQMTFSQTCGGHAASLRAAANVLLKLSDYQAAEAVASDLIKLEPYNSSGYYLRGFAYDRSGSPKKAIDDYITANELFGNKDKIPGTGYFGLARSYEKLGRYCDAITSIETWVSLSPARNDTSQTRAMIADYTAKGRCEAATTGAEEVFPVARQGSTVKLPVTINGVRGNFILDTGATFVSLKNAFAQKAKVQVDQDSTVRLHTANGIAEGKRGRAETIQLRSLQAKDVPIVVQSDNQGTYGESVDGLLGMSFLSRFNLAIDTQTVKISTRKPK